MQITPQNEPYYGIGEKSEFWLAQLILILTSQTQLAVRIAKNIKAGSVLGTTLENRFL